MKFGSREIVDVVFRAKSKMTLGSRTFYKNDPVIYFDTLKTSSLEGGSTTVYATGGRGNARLLAWDGDRTLALNMEDALLTPESFTILAGASLKTASTAEPIYAHTTTQVEVSAANTIVLDGIACWNGGYLSVDGVEGSAEAIAAAKARVNNDDNYEPNADIYVMKLTDSGEMEVEPCKPKAIAYKDGTTTITCYGDGAKGSIDLAVGDVVLVDYYTKQTSDKAYQIEITPEILSDYFYIEGSTLYRRESDGKDMAAEVIIPKGKVQTSFTLSMAATGDPSTFNFVVDAFPDYTKFDKDKKVQAVIQVIGEENDSSSDELRENCDATAGGNSD